MNLKNFKKLIALTLIFSFSNAQNLISREAPSVVSEKASYSTEELKSLAEEAKSFVLREEFNVGCLHCHLGGLLGKQTDSQLDQVLKKFIAVQLKELSEVFKEIQSKKDKTQAADSEETYMKNLEKVVSALFKKLSDSDYKVIYLELKKQISEKGYEKYRFRHASDHINRALYAAIFELKKEISQDCFIFLMELAGYIELVIQSQLLEKGLCGKEYKKLKLPIMATNTDL